MELTWKKTLAVWWSVFWRGTLLGALFGAILGGVLGAVMGAQGYPTGRIQVYSSLLGYVGGLIGSFFAVKLALQKHLPSLIALAESTKGGRLAGKGPETDFFPER